MSLGGASFLDAALAVERPPRSVRVSIAGRRSIPVPRMETLSRGPRQAFTWRRVPVQAAAGLTASSDEIRKASDAMSE